MDRNRGLDINALRQQLEDLFEDFLPNAQDRRRGGRGGEQTQHLPLNVAETEDAFTLSAPLPGFQPEDVDITVRGQNVTLRAQHKTTPPQQENLTRHEWGQGVFQRSFELPAPVDADQTTATFRQGVVTVTLPKSAPAEIPVEGEEPGKQAPEAAPEETAAEAAPEAEAAAPEAEAPSAEKEKSSFYMAPGRGRRGRRHGGQKNAEPAPAEAPEGAAAEEQAAGAAEGEIPPDETAAPAGEAEAREADREQQSGFDGAEEPPATETAATPEEALVAETLEIGGADAPAESPETGAASAEAPEASDAAVETFAEESERAAEPPVE